MIKQEIIDILGQIALWATAGGLTLKTVWDYFTTRKERKLNLEKDAGSISAGQIENMNKIIATYETFNARLEEKVEKYQRRVGALEETLRKQAFDHQKKLEEIDNYWKERITNMENEHRKAMQQIESFYREKCRECNLDQKA